MHRQINEYELTTEKIETEIKRLKRKKSGRRILKETVFSLLVVVFILSCVDRLCFYIYDSSHKFGFVLFEKFKKIPF